jgi:hypothetical protein
VELPRNQRPLLLGSPEMGTPNPCLCLPTTYCETFMASTALTMSCGELSSCMSIKGGTAGKSGSVGRLGGRLGGFTAGAGAGWLPWTGGHMGHQYVSV